MKMRFLVATVLLLMFVATTALTAEPGAKSSSDQQNSAAADTKTSIAVITEKNFTFEPVVDGSEVAHDYLIKNTGEGTLEISRVKTG